MSKEGGCVKLKVRVVSQRSKTDILQFIVAIDFVRLWLCMKEDMVMIDKKKIKKLTNTATYNKGLDIYYQDKVVMFETDKIVQDQITIKAMVKGSGRKRYEVELLYDEEYDNIVEEYCECPAFYSYSGICKHCVAVLLEFEKYQYKQQTIFDFIDEHSHKDEKTSSGKSREESKSGYGRRMLPAHAKETTPAMKELLHRQMVKATLPLLAQDTYGKIELEPIFECSPGYIAVEFKVGAAVKYVLKDIFEFARNLEMGLEHSYGKKLKFVHVAGAFEPSSWKMAEFILRWVKENGNRYIQYTYSNYSYGTAYSKLRKISLSGGELEELFEALGQKPVMINVNGTGERMWEFSDQKMPRNMRITGQKNGIEVEADQIFGYQCVYHTITFKDGFIYKESKEELLPIQDFIHCMAELPDRKFYLDKNDVPIFCRELLPLLEKQYKCEKTNFDEAAYGVTQVSFEIYLDAPQRDFITCKVWAVYGEKKYEVYKKGEESGGRDIVKETQVGNIVASFCNAFDEGEHAMVISGEEDKIYELLVHGIPRLQELGEVFISDTLKRINVVQTSRVEVGVSLSGDMLELKVTASDLSRDELAEILSKYDRKKKYYRLRSGSFINVEDEGMQTLLEVKQNLNLTEAQLKKDNVAVPRYRALYLDGALKEKHNVLAVRNRTFKELVRNMKTIEDNDFEVPASLETILRQYQKTGFTWLKTLRHNGFGGILADDMGLGKTLQVIAFLLSEFLEAKAQDNRRALIVAPASLVFNWKSEFVRFAPSLPVKMVTGPAPERREIIQKSQGRDILITSYELLKRDIKEYEGIQFFCEVIDEAQYIKNHTTQSAKAVKEIEAGCRFALTGTPIENRLSELWSIFDYLMPGFLYSYQHFRSDIELPVVQNQDEKAMGKLQRMVRPFVLRRLKRDVLTDLPDKLEECVYAHMEGEQWKLYCAHVQRLKMMIDKQSEEEFKSAKIQVLAELTKLRQLCCDPSLIYENYENPSAKAAMCLDLIKNAIEGGHKVLLFSQFTSMLENLQRKLDEEQISYYVLTGATPKEKRLKLVENFNKDDTSVFCISLKAGGTGLNLTAADIVIHYDPWWNLAVQNQATDRAHRIGQKNVVSVYKLIMKDTIEENIIRLQERKKELAEQVLSGENLGSGSFSKEELLELLTM